MASWEIALVAFIGASFGSFATVVVYRMPRNQTWIFGRSRCPRCLAHLDIRDLFPLLSWIAHCGKCRHCHVSIGGWYLVTEITSALIFVISYLVYGISWIGIVVAVTGLCLLIISLIDLEYLIIPDPLQAALLVLGLIYAFLSGSTWMTVLAGALLGLSLGIGLRWLMLLWKKQEGLGFGDVKFFVVSGVFLGWELFMPFLFLSGMLGLPLGMLWRAIGRGKQFPFAPALSAALFISLLWPEYVVLFWKIGEIIQGQY